MNSQKIGDSFKSPTFIAKHVGDIKWYLKLYPKGQEDKNKDYLSLYLFSKSDIRAQSIFIIFNNKGEEIVNKTMVESRFGGKRCVYPKFILRSFVVNPENSILDNGKLTIVCKINYTNSYVESKSRLHGKANRPKIEDNVFSRLRTNYETLLNDGRFSDLSIVAEGKTVKVHKSILAMGSLVFAAMFVNEIQGKPEKSVEITDIRYDVFLEMLRFVYAAKVENIDAVAGELAVAADKYALDDLKVMCEKTMMKILNPENVIAFLQVADALRMDTLKKNAVQFIVEKAGHLTEKWEFGLLPVDIVRNICQSFAKNVK